MKNTIDLFKYVFPFAFLNIIQAIGYTYLGTHFGYPIVVAIALLWTLILTLGVDEQFKG